jgi:PAS domain-containing protein
MMRRGGKPDMTYDAARQPGRPGRLAEQQVRRHRPVSLEPLLKAALQSALPGLILLDAARRVRLVTRGAAAMLGLPEAGRDAGTPIMRLLARSFWLDQPALQTLAVAFRTSDGLAPRKILLTLPHPAGARVVALDLRAAGPI